MYTHLVGRASNAKRSRRNGPGSARPLPLLAPFRKKTYVTLDAMDWVWKHSQSKGNARLVLLACADRTRTSACEVKLSYSELMLALNAGRPAVRDAIKAAEKLGELELLEEGRGTRSARYRLPMAVDYVRSKPSSGSKFKPLEGAEDPSSGSEIKPLGPEQDPSSGLKSEPQADASGLNFVASGSKFKPHHQYQQDNQQQPGPTAADVSDPVQRAQPLIDAMTDAGLVVSWTMQAAEWLELAALVDRVDIPLLITRAQEAIRPGRTVQYATYFLRGTWRGLPSTKNRPGPARDSPRAPELPPHCKDLDCDPETRMREYERDGLPELHRCPDCHPALQGARK